MAGAELCQSHRQVTVTAQPLIEDLDVPGAVHRLDRVVTVLRGSREHVLRIVLPVARALPERTIHDHRRLHFAIAVLAEQTPDVLFDFLPNGPALRVPEDHPGRLVLQVKEVELPTQLAMIPLLGFFEHVQVCILVFLTDPGGAVDALQLFVSVVPAPVGTGQLHQLEDLQSTGRWDMRTTTKVNEVSFAVQRDSLIRRYRIDQLRLVVLALGLEEGDSLIALPDFPLHRQIAPHQFRHPPFDRRQIVKRERTLECEIVVEAALDDRANGHLCRRKQLLHRIGHEVCRRVANDLEPLGILFGDDRQMGIAVDHE
ncbi:MAG: hypothetical protein FAZ92_02233 [Accumulibacter sp.]|nr:MAG: hypothetical protein FAZ92_02233 [Accumulibacter sp.]